MVSGRPFEEKPNYYLLNIKNREFYGDLFQNRNFIVLHAISVNFCEVLVLGKIFIRTCVTHGLHVCKLLQRLI